MSALARILNMARNRDGRAVELNRLFSSHDGEREGIRVEFKYFCACDADEELSFVLSVGENSFIAEEFASQLEGAAAAFLAAVERHRAKPKAKS